MSDPYASSGGWSTPARSGVPRSGPTSRASAGDEWGPATSVRFGAGRPGAETRNGTGARTPAVRADDDIWSAAGPLSTKDQRATRRAERDADRDAERARAQRAAALDLHRPARVERGLPWWAALLVLIAIAAVGGVIDTIGANQVRGGYNIGIVAASVLAILVVKRSHMFPIVIAPPIVYSLGAVFQLYLRSSGLNDRKVILDAAANYLVYGFPAIAAATAAVLIIAGIRMIARK